MLPSAENRPTDQPQYARCETSLVGKNATRATFSLLDHLSCTTRARQTILAALVNLTIAVIVDTVAHLAQTRVHKAIAIVTVTIINSEAIAVEITRCLVYLSITVIIGIIVFNLDSARVNVTVGIIAVTCILRVAITIIVEDLGALIDIAIAVIVRTIDGLNRIWTDQRVIIIAVAVGLRGAAAACRLLARSQ